MRHIIAATGFVLLLPLIGAVPAQAQDYPWCAVYGGRFGGPTNCGFSTLEQCKATVSGIGGFCQRNPRWVPPSERPRRGTRRR